MSEEIADAPPTETPPSGMTSGVADPTPSSEAPPSSEAQPSTPTYSSPFDFRSNDELNEANLSALPENAGALKNLIKKYGGDTEQISKGIESLNYLASQKGFQPLDPAATDEQKAKHNEILKNVLSVPDKNEGYGIEKPEGMDDAAWDKLNVGEYLDIAREHNVSPHAMNALWNLEMERGQKNAEDALKAEETAMANEQDLMTQEYGNAVPQMYQKANEVADLTGFPRSQIKDKAMVEHLNEVHKLISEDKLSQGDSQVKTGGSHNDAVNAIMNDPNNPYHADYISDNPTRQKRASNEITRLLQLGLKRGESMS